MNAASELPLSDWNWAELMLHQALVGAISPNFRLVELGFESGCWSIVVTLTEDRSDDREMVEEVCDDMSCYLMDLQGRISRAAEANCAATVVVSREPIIVDPASSRRRVFMMRQN
ncbi:hypothetical protein K9B35_00905 [Sphingomonas sp. R647]|uniref:hypothetical protein n=1 Tax=Sphingomonas sp. R647 TaxID=2875233 RepID=UPI001CD208DB|nr:hypothetical protein [Sphingomonas sp. R647]MCA1196516.1 hypothetical protein [Sphingomonas sp. R647]